ncbi:hypothetical protein LJR296_008012 [Cupriavidus necator]|uniref:hypothetical protein n=1 Tax=Cupriavidus necator TaxID=106590 RepID=UPI003ECE0E97
MAIKIEGSVGQVVNGDLVGSVRIKMGKKGMTVTTEGAANDWERGYFCAVAVLLREEGSATTAVRSLFAQGGDSTKSDPQDLALFRQHGLIG